MKRSDFLKRLGIGLGAVVVAPRVLAEMPAKEEYLWQEIEEENSHCYEASLFFMGMELSYNGYKRVPVYIKFVLKGNHLILEHEPIVFPRTSGGNRVYFDSVRIFHGNNEPIIYAFETKSVIDGVITVMPNA